MVRPPLRWTGFAVASLAVGGVLGWLGTERSSDPGRGGSTAASSSSLPGTSPAPGQGVPALPALQAPSLPTAPAATLPSLDVTREAGVIRIASANARLADVARALAQATRTTVRGAEALAAVATPVTLRWQGHDTAAAWDALLGRFASTAVSCSSTACELWIVGVNAPRTAGGAPVNGTLMPNEAAPPPVPIAVPLPVTPPAPPANGDENTETN